MLCDPLEGGAYIGQYCIDVLKNTKRNKKRDPQKTSSGNNYASFEDQVFGSESRRRPCCPPHPPPWPPQPVSSHVRWSDAWYCCTSRTSIMKENKKFPFLCNRSQQLGAFLSLFCLHCAGFYPNLWMTEFVTFVFDWRAHVIVKHLWRERVSSCGDIRRVEMELVSEKLLSCFRKSFVVSKRQHQRPFFFSSLISFVHLWSVLLPLQLFPFCQPIRSTRFWSSLWIWFMFGHVLVPFWIISCSFHKWFIGI